MNDIALYLNSNKITQAAGVSVTTQGGNITYSATNSPQTNDIDQGISIGDITGSRSVVNANGGNILMNASFATTGTVGGSGGDRAIFLGKADIITSSTGTINLTGDATNSVNAASTTFHAWGFDISDSRIQTAAGAITITGTGGKLSPNSRGIVFWDRTFDGVPKILSASGQITIIDQKPDGLTGTGVYNGLYLRPISTADFWIGADGTNVATSSSNVILRSDKISVVNESSKFVKFNTSGTVLFESVGTSFETEPTLSGLFLGSTVSGFTLGKTTNTSNLTLNSATTIAGPVSVYGGDITLNGAINTSAGNATADVLLKSRGTIIATADIITNGGDITLWSDADANGAGGIRIDDNVDLDSRTQSDRTANTNTAGGGKITLAGGLDDGGTASGVATLLSGLTSSDGYPDGYAVNSGSGATQSGIVLGTSSSATGHNSNINFLSGGGDIRIQGLATNNSSNAGNGPTGLLFFHGHTFNAGTSGNITLLGNANLTSGGWGIGLDFAAWRTTSYAANGTVRTANGTIKVIGRATGGTSGNIALAIDGEGNNRNIFAATGTGSISLDGLATGTNPLDVRLTNVDLLAASGPITVTAAGTSGTKIGDYNIGNGLFLGQKSGSLVTSSTSNLLMKSNFIVTTNKPIAFVTSGTVTLEPFGTSFGGAQTFSNVSFATTISSLTLGKTTNTANLTLGAATTIAGPVSAYGGDIALNESITTTTNTGHMLIKAAGNIRMVGEKTLSTQGANVVLWSNSDGGTTAGEIVLQSNFSGASGARIQTNGGHIWLGGGSGTTTWNGITVGNGYAVSGSAISFLGSTSNPMPSGVFFQGAKLLSGGGNIYVGGQSQQSNSRALVTAGPVEINSGTGTIEIQAIATTTAGAFGTGWHHDPTVPAMNGNLTITSANATSSAILLNADATASNVVGGDLQDEGSGLAGVVSLRTTSSGGLVYNSLGSSARAAAYGLRLGYSTNQGGTLELLSNSGDITLNTGNRSIFLANNLTNTTLGFKATTPITASTSQVKLITNDLSASGALNFNTSGQLIIEPFGSSFTSAVNTTQLIYSAGVTGLTIGKAGNTAGITIGSTTTVAGPVTLFGGALAINGALTATNSTINLNATGAVTQSAALTATNLALGGSGTFTLNNAGNNVATLAAGDNTTRVGNTSFTDASGGLTIGTVGNTTGIQSTGTVLVETLVGDLTLSGNITTTNTTASAITLNAGKSTAIGTTTGGNILVTGTPTVTTGTGGIAKLFSGSDAASTGLTTLVGGASNTRDGVDETTTSFSPVLTANTNYALYRNALQIVAPNITSFTPTTAGNGETVVITGTGFTGATSVKFGNVNATSFVVNSNTQITAVVGAAASGDVYVQNSAGSDTEPGFIFKVVELKFEGNTLDQTAADRDGTVVGTATYGPGASGQAICFTSNAEMTSLSNYLRLPTDLIRGRGTNFTVSLRFKTATFGAILGYQATEVNGSGAHVPILYVQEDGKLSANLWQLNLGRLSVISSGRVDDNNWHKVEFSVAPGSITVYIDGVLERSTSGTIDHLTMSFNQLGAADITGVWGGITSGGWVGFTGCIDEFLIVDKALTASQIQQVTALPQPTITSFTPTTAKSGETVTITGTNFGSASSVKLGGVEARRFTIVSATEIRAIVPFNATVNSTIEVTTAAGTISGTTFIYDCNSNALDFDGTDDHLIIGDVIENLGAFSQEAWVYWKGSSQPYSEIFSKETVSALSITNTNKLHANFGNGTSWGAGVNSTTSIPLNTWTHVAVTRSSSGAVKLYINGVLDASSATLSLSGQNPLARGIGAKPTSSSILGYFNGSIDELKVWSSERTQAQVISDLSSEAVGNESGLLAYYNFNQGTAAGTNTTITTLNNLTAATNLDGTLTNMARSGTTSNFVSGVWPVIITQPAATLGLCTNATSGNVLTVSAAGHQLTYQWFGNTTNSNSGGTAISGANAASFTVPTATAGTVYYYAVVSSGCSSTTATSTVSTVTASVAPVAGTLSGSQSICVGLTTSFSSTETGGTWSSSNAAIATVNASTGLVTGVGSGTATMTYTVIGCSSVSATRTVIVTAPPAVPVLSGSQNVCINGTTQFIATGESGALTFNGTTNIVETANNISALNITGDITVETWVKVNQLPNDWVRLVGKGDASNRTYGFWLNTDGRLLWQIYGSGTDPALFSTTSLQTGTWYHIAATRVGNVHTIYINGVERGTVTASITPVSSTMPLTLGFSGNWHTYLNGQMDEVRVWNVGRTATQINDNKDVEIAAQSGLVAYYKFNQGTSGGNNAGLTTLIDESGNGNNGTLRNFALIGNASNWSSRSGVPTTAGSWTSSNTSVATVSSTGVVTGVAAGTATITFTATGGGGCAEVTATRTVTVAPIPVITYASNYSVERTSAITAIQPTSSGATVTSYAISPALPTGLTFSTTNGTISGTPTVNSTSRTYTVTATAATGCVGTTTFTLEVFSAVAPSALSYAPGSQTVRQGTAITNMVPTASGGSVASYSISPALPTGLSLNTTTGIISGTLTAQQTGTVTYTITATNSGGSTTATVTLVYNTAPTDVALSSTSVAENAASGTAVGTLSATDADAGDTHTYTLVSGTGSTDNASFTISGNSLRTAAVFDFETKSSYSVRVRVTDAGGLTFEKAFTIDVTDVNETPTNISASASSVAENAASGTSVATLSATDADAGDTFTYTLVSGTGDTDNASFTITGSTLSTAAVFDFETKSSYSVRVRVTDAGGLTFEKVFTIGVTDINDAPTNITASTGSVAENAASGTAVASLSATDADAGDTFTYTLVSGTGDTDNASFTISGSTLSTAAVFDFETKSSYSVRVRVTDAGGLTFEKEFTISVTDVNEAPTALALSNASVLENAASGTAVGTLAGTDADAGDTHTYTLVSGTGSTDNASFTITGTTLSTAAVFNFEAKNSYSVRVRVTDAGGLSFERAFTISVTDVNEAPTLTAITDRRVYNVSTSQVVNLAGITAGPETAQSTTTTVSTDKPATFSSISIVGTQIQFTLAAGIVTPQDVVVTVRVKDNGGVANGGVDSVVRTFKLGIDPMPVAAASPNLITLGATSQLSAAGANAVNYTWVAVGGSGIVGSGATINVRPKGTTTYAVVVTNSFGYQATVPVLLTVIVDYKLVPNNLVTPNGDGVNDKWVIPNIDMYPDNEVMVYDKAGRAVFAKRGYNNEWDGTVNGKKLKEDAYFYVIKFNKDGALPIRGYLSIVR